MEDSKKIYTLIIEDEKDHIKELCGIIDQYFPEIEIIGITENVQTSLEFLAAHDPDLVLSDIRLPDGESFDIFEQLHDRKFEIIFITAFHEFALKAFELSAIHYLYKPVNYKSLKEALKRWKERKQLLSMETRLKIFLERYYSTSQKLVITEKDSDLIINTNEIIYIKAEGHYSKFCMINGTENLGCKSLTDYVSLLPPYHFFRIHRNAVVNLGAIKKIKRIPRFTVILKNDEELAVSKQNRTPLRDAMKDYLNPELKDLEYRTWG